MHLRTATPEDLPHVRALLEHVALPLDGLTEHFGSTYAVAMDGNDTVGVAGIEIYGGVGLLRSVAVAPTHRGRGIGELLVRNRIAWAVEQGLEDLYLLTTTAPGYFPRLGFTAIPRETLPAAVRAAPAFAVICPASAIVMRRPLVSD